MSEVGTNLRNQRTPKVTRLLELSRQQPLIVGDLVMVEVPQGARDEARAARSSETFGSIW